MKKYIVSILSLLLFNSCEEVIELELPEGEPRLVIEAVINKSISAQAEYENYVRLSLTAPFYENNNPAVSDASIQLTGSNGFVVNYFETGEPGVYLPEFSFAPADEEQYTLNIIYNNETYQAVTTLVKGTHLTSIEQGDSSLFGEEETEIIISFTDNGDREDYYLFDLGYGLYFTSKDEFFNGQDFSFSYFYEDLDPGDNVNVNLINVTKDFYTYMSILISQSGINGGNPFAAIPGTVKGNFNNLNTPSRIAYGYFRISEVDRASLIVE